MLDQLARTRTVDRSCAWPARSSRPTWPVHRCARLAADRPPRPAPPAPRRRLRRRSARWLPRPATTGADRRCRLAAAAGSQTSSHRPAASGARAAASRPASTSNEIASSSPIVADPSTWCARTLAGAWAAASAVAARACAPICQPRGNFVIHGSAYDRVPETKAPRRVRRSDQVDSQQLIHRRQHIRHVSLRDLGDQLGLERLSRDRRSLQHETRLG